MAARLLPARLDGFTGGYRWGLWGVPAPHRPRMGAVLVVQACLDEQALSRRMLAHAARGMAEAGWWMLAIDPVGTGDSAGDHGEASLERWRDDLREAARRLRMQAPEGPLALLGVRLGGLIAIDLAHLLPQPPQGLVLWSPPARGAALVGPLTGAGIAFALESGMLAGETLAAALATGDVSSQALRPYADAVTRRTLPWLRMELWAQRLIGDPGRLRIVLNATRPLPPTAALGARLLLSLG